MQYQEQRDNKQTFIFVRVTEDHPPTTPPTQRVVLEKEDGTSVSVPKEHFDRTFELVATTKSTTAIDAVKEVLAFIRLNSTVRFVALPFFLAALAILVKTYKETGPLQNSIWVLLGGTALAFSAAIVEIVLSRNIIVWWKALSPELSVPPWRHNLAHRSPRFLRTVRFALFLPYAGAMSYWIAEASDRVAQALLTSCYAFSCGTWSACGTFLVLYVAAYGVWETSKPHTGAA